MKCIEANITRWLAVLTLLMFMLIAHAQGKNGGVNDQDLNQTSGTSDKTGPNCGTGCHAILDPGANISITAIPAGPYTPGMGVNITVTTSGTDGIAFHNILGIMLLNNSQPLSGNIKNDGWVITQDPNSNTPTRFNYNQKISLASLNQTFNWTVQAPSTSGIYYIKADARYGTQGNSNPSNSRNITSTALTMIVVLPDTSFSVTIPSGYSEAFFNATRKTESNVNASGQTGAAGFLSITNTGTVAEKFYANVTAAMPSGVTLKADTDNNPAGAATITALTQIISNLAVSASQYVWLWADYNNAAPMNEQRTLTVNSST